MAHLAWVYAQTQNIAVIIHLCMQMFFKGSSKLYDWNSHNYVDIANTALSCILITQYRLRRYKEKNRHIEYFLQMCFEIIYLTKGTNIAVETHPRIPNEASQTEGTLVQPF